METTKDRVSDLTTINFSITKCPRKVYERFVKYAKGETSDNYSMALKMLLDGMEGNIKEVLLYEQYMNQKAELFELREMIEEMQGNTEEPKKKPKTFGKKKD